MALDASALRNGTLSEKPYTLIVALLNRMRVRARDDLAGMFVRRMGAIHKLASDELDVIQQLPTDVGSLDWAANDGHALVEIGVEISEHLNVIPEQIRVGGFNRSSQHL